MSAARRYAAPERLTLVMSAGRPRRYWTSARRWAVVSWIQEAAPVLRLSDWTIELEFHEPAAEGSYASMQFTPDSRHALMRFGAAFEALSATEAAATLTHELLHCHLQPLHDLVERSASAVMPVSATKILDVAVTQQVETIVNNLADALAPLLPALVWES